jgi:putative endonuclease
MVKINTDFNFQQVCCLFVDSYRNQLDNQETKFLKLEFSIRFEDEYYDLVEPPMDIGVLVSCKTNYVKVAATLYENKNWDYKNYDSWRIYANHDSGWRDGFQSILKYFIENKIDKNKLIKSFTLKYNINKLVYYEVVDNIESAILREKQLKAGSRQKKVNLINKLNPKWEDLYKQIIS